MSLRFIKNIFTIKNDLLDPLSVCVSFYLIELLTTYISKNNGKRYVGIYVIRTDRSTQFAVNVFQIKRLKQKI